MNKDRIKQIEKEHNVKILMVTDTSPYPHEQDIQFIYLRPTFEYLRLDKDNADIIVATPEDICGFDLRYLLNRKELCTVELYRMIHSEKVIYQKHGIVNLLKKFQYNKHCMYNYAKCYVGTKTYNKTVKLIEIYHTLWIDWLITRQDMPECSNYLALEQVHHPIAFNKAIKNLIDYTGELCNFPEMDILNQTIDNILAKSGRDFETVPDQNELLNEIFITMLESANLTVI